MLLCAPERGEVGGALRSCIRHEELVHRLRALPPSVLFLRPTPPPTHSLTQRWSKLSDLTHTDSQVMRLC